MPKEKNVSEKNTKDLQKNSLSKKQKKAQLRNQLLCSILSNSGWMKPRAEYPADHIARAAVTLANEVLAELEMEYNRL